MHVSSASSYEHDSDTYFLDFLKSSAQKSNDVIDDDEETSVAEDCCALLPMTALEGDVLYTLAGWSVFKEYKRYSSVLFASVLSLVTKLMPQSSLC